MYTYFADCQTLEEGKKLYRELCMQHHPDRGGDLRTMQAINAEYARFQKDEAIANARRRQQDAHAENRRSAADFHDLDEVGEALRVMIEFALNLDGVDVELMGLWVWLTGETRKHKDTFKAWNESHDTKWKWSPKKSAWYFAGVPSFNRQDTTLDEIRQNYGSTKFARSKDDDRERVKAHELAQGMA